MTSEMQILRFHFKWGRTNSQTLLLAKRNFLNKAHKLRLYVRRAIMTIFDD